MKKEFWTKRIALMALTGLISSGLFVGCQKNENTNENTNISTESENQDKHNENTNIPTKSENQDKYFVPNLVIAEYKNNGEKEAKVVNLKSSHEDLTLLDFVTDPTKFYKNGKIVTIANENAKMELEDLGYTDIQIIDDVYSYVQQYCEFGEGLNVSYDVIKKVEEGYGNSRTIKSILAENANREWKEYHEIVKVAYVMNGEQTICLMGLESDSATGRIYRSLTCPEITLAETIDENKDIIKREIVTNSMLSKPNEELRQNAKVRKFGTYMSTHQFSYDKVLEYEKHIIEEEKNKIGNELLNVQEKLNVSSEEDSKYGNILSIGDVVNLVDDNVLVYEDRSSLKKKENAVTSLYGTSMMRCISTIDMSNGCAEVTVDNMEDYETYLSNGYFEIGYSLVNENSMDEFGNLIVEFRCDKDDVYMLKR